VVPRYINIRCSRAMMCCMHCTVVLCMSVSHDYAQWLWLLISNANNTCEVQKKNKSFTDRDIGCYVSTVTCYRTRRSAVLSM
jgi:hypothetical protein